MNLKLGSRGTAVKLMQHQLKQVGYGIKSDGIFGPLTWRAVRDFQKTHRLVVDGIAGHYTLTALGAAKVTTTYPYTQYFKYDEFISKNDQWTGKNGIPKAYFSNLQTLMMRLEKVRSKVKLPIIVRSGFRSAEYNTAVGGATHSQHLFAKAADIHVKRYAMSTYDLAKLIYQDTNLRTLFGGMGLGSSTNLHVDIRQTDNKKKPTIWWYGNKTWQEWSK